jgi:hypothetical protein
MAQKGATILSLGGTIGMLHSKPSFTTRINIFGYIWTSHKSIGSSYTSTSRNQPKCKQSNYDYM